MPIRHKEDFEIPDILKNIYKEMEVSPVGLLKNYALNLIYSKIHKYEIENRCFEKKYHCSFKEFKHNVESMKDKEDFEWEDDLADWTFAVESSKYWQKKVQKIKCE